MKKSLLGCLGGGKYYVTNYELATLQAEYITHKLMTQDGSPPPSI